MGGDPMTSRFIVADVFDGLASLEDGSVDLVVTSPPFLALRSYLPADHEHKELELGSEATPGAFIDRMLDVVEALTPKLTAHASIVFELGDTYAGSGGAGGDYNEGGLRDGTPGFSGSARAGRLSTYSDERGNPDGMRDSTFQGGNTRNGGGKGWPLEKSKVLIPQLFAIALAYGFNPLTGRQTEPWRVRNTVAWCRPNPPVGRDGDKFRPATSFLTIACKARDRYWDGDAVRTEHQTADALTRPRAIYDTDQRGPGGDRTSGNGSGSNPAGAPLLDYWVIPTAPYKGSHYATYPPDLVVPLVKAMCPSRVCRVCGKPSERIVEVGELVATDAARIDNWDQVKSAGADSGTMATNLAASGFIPNHERSRSTVGWSDCGHNSWRPGLILDPFAGSGTTLAVSSGHGFDCVGIDLDSRNADLARERVGMFLEVETLSASGCSGTTQ